LEVFLYFTSKKEEKVNASLLKTCHFKISGDITINPGSGTLDNDRNK